MKNSKNEKGVVPSSQSTFKQVVTIPETVVLDSFRNNDHTLESFLLDPIDNSIDAGAKEIRIEFETENGVWKKVLIIDDGVKGMDEPALIKSLTLGGSNDKDCNVDLGCYGVGLQNSGLKVGRKITVKSKGQDTDFTMGILDLDKIMYTHEWSIDVYDAQTADEKIYRDTYHQFKQKLNSKTGTIVEFSKIDRLFPSYNTETEDLPNIIKKEIGLVYFYYIMRGVKIYVNGDLVEGRDPLYRDNEDSIERANNTFIHNGMKFGYRFHYLNPAIKKSLWGTGDNRNQVGAGLYIYRNDRLVGKALDFNGLFKKRGDGYSNGIRAELRMLGDADVIPATNTKRIHDHCEIDQGFRNKMESVFQSMVDDCRYTDQNRKRSKTKKDESLFTKWDTEVNNNPMWEQVGNKPVKTVFVKNTEFGPDYTYTKDHGEYVLKINIDHMSWKYVVGKEDDTYKKQYYHRILSEAVSRDFITNTKLTMDMDREDLMRKVDKVRGDALTILIESTR